MNDIKKILHIAYLKLKKPTTHKQDIKMPKTKTACKGKEIGAHFPISKIINIYEFIRPIFFNVSSMQY